MKRSFVKRGTCKVKKKTKGENRKTKSNSDMRPNLASFKFSYFLFTVFLYSLLINNQTNTLIDPMYIVTIYIF